MINLPAIVINNLISTGRSVCCGALVDHLGPGKPPEKMLLNNPIIYYFTQLCFEEMQILQLALIPLIEPLANPP